MNTFKFLLGLSLLTLVLSNCKKEDDPDTDPVKPGLVLNELMAVNTKTISDQNGEFDDWIELYNNTDSTINLLGYYLTDSKSELSKWAFPDVQIASKSYLCVWADGDVLQSGLHTNYKLSSLGETVLLLTPDMKVIDQMKYGEQPVVIGETFTEKSFARMPNGTGTFSWHLPSFNSENISNP